MTPLSLEDLSAMNLGRTRKTRKEARAAKRDVATSRTPPTCLQIQPPAPSPSSSSQPASSHRQILSSPSAQPHSPPILSPDDSIFSESAAPYAKDPTPSPSSSLSAAPERFVKVTDWKSMQAFQYQLHLEHEQQLQEREARNLELLEEVNMQINHLRRELANRGPSTRQ
nr:hypothetical protein Itr_chr04CG14510 [Ipomoea trifida]